MIDKNIKIDFLNELLSMEKNKCEHMADQIISLKGGFTDFETLIIEVLTIVGDGWELGDYSLAQVYMSSHICEELILKYLPLYPSEKKYKPVIGIGVLLDHHALGKRIVLSVIRSAGFEIIDLGHGLTVEKIVEKAVEAKLEVLIISTLMLPSALKVKKIKEKLSAIGSEMKIIAGGAPFRFDSELWKRVGADADGKNATDIVEIILKVVS